ncbi:hypothetical protein [Pseudonocardia spinosispora]|uniref:hypothetical protein n=1 Tax=Pseudonocardia spinosispora TaxID=103441 RepID=UPI000401F897|nr:hypothetical protein [Pseudonocardia spinosispora]
MPDNHPLERPEALRDIVRDALARELGTGDLSAAPPVRSGPGAAAKGATRPKPKSSVERRGPAPRGQLPNGAHALRRRGG